MKKSRSLGGNCTVNGCNPPTFLKKLARNRFLGVQKWVLSGPKMGFGWSEMDFEWPRGFKTGFEWLLTNLSLIRGSEWVKMSSEGSKMGSEWSETGFEWLKNGF